VKGELVEATGDVPDIEVQINGSDMPLPLYADLLEVEVQDDTEAPSACKLSLVAWDDAKIDLSRIDAALFDMGSELEIKLG